ncbi:hypothetical protein MTP09_00770 [Chryseobacterium suipulveris]|uniref:Uncharacterized protein n=1 Tax=Chryseobacterium suipulveris TaxID=2929800 RepID=A0ABY4BPS7_9FLAO|nr:hypothetical protein [Chryseobacterium suipulveris]UOE41208.1 hypothetical protein MTP09_00770 [Chryseobacterium suipulveris]
MSKIVISDTSCLVLLSKINELDVVEKLFSEIITTNEVADEFGEILPPFIKVFSVTKDQKDKVL